MNSFDASRNEQVSDDSSTSRKINSLLNSPKSRIEGLQLLNAFLPHCSDEDFLQFCISWMHNCCKVDGLTIGFKEFAIHLLNELFKISSNYQELKKSVSFFITTRYFDFFFKYFLQSQAGWSCTETCMLLYRGACGPFQDNLEKHLKTKIGKNSKISSKIAYCYALLPSIGGGGSEGICYKKNWRTSFAKFLSIVHSLLDDLFADVEEFQEYEIPEYAYDKSQNDSSPADLAIILHNHCSVLSSMLVSEYPAPKNIPTDLIFQLLCRGLAVTPKALAKRPTTDILSLKKVLPDIHCSFLSLLKAVIVTCKNQLLPYSHLVCKLLSQTLEWTEPEFAYGKEKCYGQLRKLAYEGICNWVATTGNGSCAEVISSVVITNSVSDILSKKRVVFLKETKQHKKSKKVEHGSRRISPAVNTRLCHSALKALQFLLKFTGVLLKPEEHKFLQEFAIKLILEVQRSLSDMAVPFDASTCRLELYALLVELTLQPCPKWPPPTHFALSLLKRGLCDDCPQVRSLCSMALSVMTVIIHPQYNNGGFLSFENPSTSQREMQLQWKKVSTEADRENPSIIEESAMNSSGDTVSQTRFESAELCESGGTDPKEKVNNLGEESDGSSCGDSRTTVTFSKNATNSSSDSLNVIEETKEKCSLEKPTSEDEPSPKIQKTTTEESSADDPEPLERPLEITIIEDKLDEPDPMEVASSTKSISPESTSEEGRTKKRYFLRSKRKGSSEEPEEAFKRAISIDSLKSTPMKNSPRSSPSVSNTAKRPRTRALSKIETNGDKEDPKTLKRTPDDDDDILETFHDSFVD